MEGGVAPFGVWGRRNPIDVDISRSIVGTDSPPARRRNPIEVDISRSIVGDKVTMRASLLLKAGLFEINIKVRCRCVRHRGQLPGH